MPQINIKALKKKLTVEDHKKIMDSLGVERVEENPNQIIYMNADKYADRSLQKPKLYHYKNTGVYCSYTLGRSSDIIGIVQAVKNTAGYNCSFTDAVDYIMGVLGWGKEAVIRRTSKENIIHWENKYDKFFRMRNGESYLPEYSDEVMDILDEVYPQAWFDEGISIETMEKYQIKWYDLEQCATIPVYDKDGRLVGIRCRHFDPELEQYGKYRPLVTLDGQSYKFNILGVLYGLNYNWPVIEETKRVTIVESEKAVMKLDTFMGENCNAVGLMGSALGSIRFHQLIKLGVNKVIYVPDCDYIDNPKMTFEEWSEKVYHFSDQWKSYGIDVEVVWDNNTGLLGSKENATDHDLETWNKLYEMREVWIES